MNLRILTLAGCCLLVSAEAFAEKMLAHIYPIENVREVVVNGGATLELVQGDTESLRAEAVQAVLDRVKVDLTHQKLTLSVKNEKGGFFQWLGSSGDHVRFVLQVKDLSRLELSGAVSAKVGDLAVSDLKIQLSGSANAQLQAITGNTLILNLSGAGRLQTGDIDGQQLRVDLSGASHVDINGQGRVRELRVDASGASKYRSGPLSSKTAWASASGASHIELRAEEFLEAHASGASHINYYGNPQTRHHSSGASRIQGHKD